eukprot:TRINITY_DN3273_c0_g1_i1.p1 TRINITY_DN3273_c0_g1~~TRINITY_DN3273_c0_g1_i1.p1  ORF type:complete len:202 (+),score=28.84 TRINITY_DN3273_c0_g1_i1:118-723(+)
MPMTAPPIMLFMPCLVSAAGLRRAVSRQGAAWESVSKFTRDGHANGCPVDYDVPLDGRKGPSLLHLASVNNFVDHVDPWWTESHVKHYYQPEAAKAYKIAPSLVSGCGARATRPIAKGERIGPVWVPDDEIEFIVHFTPWFGRAVNHCPVANTHLEQLKDDSVWSVASQDIEAGEELTGNYNEAHVQFPMLVQGADPSWKC